MLHRGRELGKCRLPLSKLFAKAVNLPRFPSDFLELRLLRFPHVLKRLSSGQPFETGESALRHGEAALKFLQPWERVFDLLREQVPLAQLLLVQRLVFPDTLEPDAQFLQLVAHLGLRCFASFDSPVEEVYSHDLVH